MKKLFILTVTIFIVSSPIVYSQFYFESCGILVPGVECILFAADAGGEYLLDNYGGFNIGDRVSVTGLWNPGCFSVCMEGLGCIENNTISACPPPSIPPPESR